MTRKMISVDEEDYKELVRARGKLEQETGEPISLGDVVAVAALGILAGIGIAKIVDELSKRR
jgi:hypothetical protein